VLDAISEALFIAGFLAIVVDPYLKKHLGRELARDSFAHILAPDLPIEIRDRILKIARDTKLYRRNYVLKATISEYGTTRVRVDFQYEFELYNAAREQQEYTQELTIDDVEDGYVKKMSVSVQGGPVSYELEIPTPVKLAGYSSYRGPRLMIEPITSAISYRCRAEWVVFRSPNDIWYNHAILPTIGLSFETHAGSSFDATHSYTDNGLWMTSEHRDIVWTRRLEY
jgi:hypothetical protein